MAREKKKKEVENFDFGIGGLFKGIEKLVDLAEGLKSSGGEIRKEGELDLSQLKEGMKGVFGFSIKTAIGGKQVVEPFGNIKKTPQGPKVEEEREPITDVFDEADEVKIYAEMPGVNQEDIKLDLKEDILDISARNGNRKYHKEILLPVKILPGNLTSSYKNGMLEIMLKKSR
ncbi:MAG: Hsp20/alpha crystallin family protein [Candidatus Wallbacteria bacterium]|nr:Hsp20/alpha crystallin family protein [Candidatus Wallbacteria bacterium]